MLFDAIWPTRLAAVGRQVKFLFPCVTLSFFWSPGSSSDPLDQVLESVVELNLVGDL